MKLAQASTSRKLLSIGLAVGLLGTLASCAEDNDTIVLGVPVADGKMETANDKSNSIKPQARQPLEDEYETALKDADRQRDVDVVTTAVSISDRIDRLREERIGVTYGCVGELLDLLDPAKGQELRELYAKEDNPDREQWRDITHSTMLSALPADLTASDPGMAVACEDDSLPQNIVAVWKKPFLDRDGRRALNNVAGGVSTEDLMEDTD